MFEDVMSWQHHLKSEKQQPYFQNIISFLQEQSSKAIYPPKHLIFNAITLTPLESIKVVILGQDPYHGPGQAHGLSFSVPDGVRPPPSLQNIFKEIANSTNTPLRRDGNLEDWTRQGVFLLNTVLTVEAHKAHSHANIGWETFTDRLITVINETQPFVVFMLWGAHANKKKNLIDQNKHTILTSTHPSPLSAHRGFIGCNHFNIANEALSSQQLTPIQWS